MLRLVVVYVRDVLVILACLCVLIASAVFVRTAAGLAGAVSEADLPAPVVSCPPEAEGYC